MGFKATKLDLGWDFRPYVDAHGYIPEPSKKQLVAYQERMVDLFGDDVDFSDEEAVKKRAAELDPDSSGKETVDALAELCSEHPSNEQLTALFEVSPLQFRAFMGWVGGTLFDPLSQTSGSRR